MLMKFKLSNTKNAITVINPSSHLVLKIPSFGVPSNDNGNIPVTLSAQYSGQTATNIF